jgi:hypothetical protein
MKTTKMTAGVRAWMLANLALLLGGLLLSACASDSEFGGTGSKEQAVVGSLVISGTVIDANGFGKAGVTITLAGSANQVRTTNASGSYEFTSLASGSYSVRPTRSGCSFIPDVVNLNSMTTSRVVDFAGAGANCGGTAKVNGGATTGPYTIRGRVLDTSGKPVVGARIQMGGATQAVRFTDFTGGYLFRVGPGSYNLWTPADCTLSPANVAFNNVNGNRTQNFTATTAGCMVATQANIVATGRTMRLTKPGVPPAMTLANVSNEVAVAGAQARLAQIMAEQPGGQAVTIAGKPAMQRSVLVRGTKIELQEGFDVPRVISITTAIAIDHRVVRFESRFSEAATAEQQALFRAAGRNFEPEDVQYLVTAAPAPLPTTAFPATGSVLPVSVSPSGISKDLGEIQVAASDTTDAVVYGTMIGPYFSLDAGATVAESGWTTHPPAANGAAFHGMGDPSVAVGAPDANGQQAFYLTMLTRVGPAASSPGGAELISMALRQSTDQGQNFTHGLDPFPVDCSDPAALCIVPDQEMLAADRVRRAETPAGTFDQLYLAWRHYDESTGSLTQTVAVACSADSGATWQINSSGVADTGADYPRVSVAPDGSFFVVYMIRPEQGEDYQLKLHKFTSCAAGFQPVQGFPVTVATPTNTADMAGMPRQPNANYSVAGFTGDPSGNTIFVTYTDETTPGNDDVMVARSADGGLTFGTPQVINTSSDGHRYFPTVCSTGTNLHVAWFDRRAGTAANATNDLTAYYRSSILNGQSFGTEYNVSTDGFEDPQCLTGFPAANDIPRGCTSTLAETLCTNLPNVLYSNGQCESPCAAGPCGSLAACDFRPGATGCTVAGESCKLPMGAVSRGRPVYGDYVIPDCAQGRIFMAWGAGSAPAGACDGDGYACTAAADCCSGFCTGGVCAPGTATCTANDAACTADNDCCSRSCQGGQCFRHAQLYTQSTSCVGTTPTDPTCQTSQPPQTPQLSANLAGSVTSTLPGYPFDLCGEGSNFTPGGSVNITYHHPSLGAPITHNIATADAQGKMSFVDSLSPVTPPPCTYADYLDPGLAVVEDVATGRTVQTVGTVPSCYYCQHVLSPDGSYTLPPAPCGNNFNGGCP